MVACCRVGGTECSSTCKGCFEGGHYYLHYLHHSATRTYTGLGKQILGGHKQNLMCTRAQEKGAVTPQETEPDLPVSVQESLVEAWVCSGLLQGQGH